METMSTKRPSVMSYFCAILFPPGYFFSRKRMGSGIVSLIICLISIPLMFVFVGLFIWIAMSIWAAWNLRYEIMNYHISEQAKAIAEKMKNTQ